MGRKDRENHLELANGLWQIQNPHPVALDGSAFFLTEALQFCQLKTKDLVLAQYPGQQLIPRDV